MPLGDDGASPDLAVVQQVVGDPHPRGRTFNEHLHSVRRGRARPEAARRSGAASVCARSSQAGGSIRVSNCNRVMLFPEGRVGASAMRLASPAVILRRSRAESASL